VSRISAGNPHDRYTNLLTLFDCPACSFDCCPAAAVLQAAPGSASAAAEGCWEVLLGSPGSTNPWSNGPVNMVNTPASRPLRGGSTNLLGWQVNGKQSQTDQQQLTLERQPMETLAAVG
jgi:hypothetical protein